MKRGKDRDELITKYVKIPESLLEEIEEEFRGFQFSEVVRAALKLYVNFFQGKLNFGALKEDKETEKKK